MNRNNDPFGAPPALPETTRAASDDEYAYEYDYENFDGFSGHEPYAPSTAQRVVTWILWILALPVLAILASRAAPDDSITPVTQLVPFFPYAVAAAVPLVVLAVMGRRYVLSLLLVVGVALGGYVAATAFLPAAQEFSGANPTDPGTLRVMSVNAGYGGADAAWVMDVVRTENVEVLAVQELTPGFEEALRAAGADELLPHRVTGKVETGSAAGSGLYSATELSEAQESTGSSTFAMPSAVVDAGGADVRIRCVHPVPPMPGNTDRWQQELQELGRIAGADSTPQILVGDFNATYDHASFRDLLGARFRDAWRETGAGLERTWPEGVRIPLLDRPMPALVQLDHVVVDRGMRLGDTRTQIVPGTDHRAVLSTVVVR